LKSFLVLGAFFRIGEKTLKTLRFEWFRWREFLVRGWLTLDGGRCSVAVLKGQVLLAGCGTWTGIPAQVCEGDFRA
jgi:hypothetical protein